MRTAPAPASRPTWAEVDLTALVHNYRLLDSLLASRAPAGDRHPPATGRESSSTGPRLIPVVKADAYGHGAVPVARALAAEGATIFAVAVVEEASELRAGGITQDILVLEGAWPGQEDDIVRHRLISTVYTADGIARLDRAARHAAGFPIPVHVKIDTGMARLGVRWDSTDETLRALAGASSLRVAGAFTHFACADEDDPAYTHEQMRRFLAALERLRAAGIHPDEIHLSNSAGLVYFPDTRKSSARPGIALYGYPPAPSRCPLSFKPVLTLKSRIGRIHRLEAGESAGYNRRFVAAGAVRAGTVPIGYADGYRRGLTGKARAVVRGKPAPVIGAISMDMMVVDLAEVPDAAEGDEVTLLGPHPAPSAEDLANLLGTISYEILCGLSARLPRIYCG